jgi:uncharacterized protein (DUF433 family)
MLDNGAEPGGAVRIRQSIIVDERRSGERPDEIAAFFRV